MPRQERTKSGTGIYHVMLRGINKQDIFEDDEDYLQMTDYSNHGDSTDHVSVFLIALWIFMPHAIIITYKTQFFIGMVLREHMLGLYQGLMQFRGKSLFFAKVKSE